MQIKTWIHLCLPISYKSYVNRSKLSLSIGNKIVRFKNKSSEYVKDVESILTKENIRAKGFDGYMNDLKKALKTQQRIIETMQATIYVSSLENCNNSYYNSCSHSI